MEALSDNLLLTLKTCTNLPSPPAVATQIIELSSCSTSSLGDVAEVVSVDPALSAKLLRMANSPLYTKQRKVENLRQAIILFGLDGTLNIALSFSLKQSAQQDDDSGLDYSIYWKRSLATAMLSQEIIQKTGGDSKDSAFLAGILQDIGMLALDKATPDLYKQLVSQANHKHIREIEQEILNADHSYVGAWLLEEWHLPSKLIEPIKFSHSESDFENNALSKAVACSSLLADIFVAEEKDIPRLLRDNINIAKQIIPLKYDVFNDVIKSVSDNYTDLASMFDIDMDNSLIFDFITEQAKEILILRNLNQIKETESLQKTAKQLKSKTQELEEMNRRDGLTKLFNRRYFDETIAVEYDNANKYKWPLGLIFIDIDFFKKINDSIGHDAGDSVLIKVGEVLLDCTRESDIVCRYGGEEFTIILPGTNLEGVKVTCERIVNTFRETSIVLNNQKIVNITVSAGAYVYEGLSTDTKDWNELVRYADQAAYHSKNQGRDQYTIHTQETNQVSHKIAG